MPGFEAVQKKKTLNAQALKLVQCLRELIVSSDEIQHGDLIKSTLSRPLFIAAESGIPEIVIELLYSSRSTLTAKIGVLFTLQSFIVRRKNI